MRHELLPGDETSAGSATPFRPPLKPAEWSLVKSDRTRNSFIDSLLSALLKHRVPGDGRTNSTKYGLEIDTERI